MSKKTSDDQSAQVTGELKGWLQGSRDLWSTVTKGTVWLVVAVGPLLKTPDLGLQDTGQKTWMYFTSFLLSVGVGLIFLMAKKWNKKKDLLRWAIASAVFLALGSAGFVSYEVLKGNWTVSYQGAEYVVGPEKNLMPDARALGEKNDAVLLEKLTVTTYEKGEIWDKGSLQKRWRTLALLRVPTFQFFAICIITLTQALRCSAAGKRGKGATAAKSAAKSVAKKRAKAEDEDEDEEESEAESKTNEVEEKGTAS